MTNIAKAGLIAIVALVITYALSAVLLFTNHVKPLPPLVLGGHLVFLACAVYIRNVRSKP